MAAKRVPSWEQAAAAVFSSSDESDCSLKNSFSDAMRENAKSATAPPTPADAQEPPITSASSDESDTILDTPTKPDLGPLTTETAPLYNLARGNVTPPNYVAPLLVTPPTPTPHPSPLSPLLPLPSPSPPSTTANPQHHPHQ